MELNLPIWTNTPETPITAEDLNAMVEAIRTLWDNRSQVGDIVYNSTLDTMEKVIERYGGTKWERIEGKFLLGANDEYEVGSTGGEKTHTLTVEEMPSHTHDIKIRTGATSGNWHSASPGSAQNSGTETVVDDTIIKRGGDQSHNNMPPYLATYIWMRVE